MNFGSVIRAPDSICSSDTTFGNPDLRRFGAKRLITDAVAITSEMGSTVRMPADRGGSQPLVAKFAVADAVTLAKGNTVGQRNALSRGDRFNPVRSLRRAPSIDHT